MPNKPSYKIARKMRGTATMTIEPAAPTTFSDKEIPSPDSQRFPKSTISPESNASGDSKVSPLVVHPGEYALSAKHPDLDKT